MAALPSRGTAVDNAILVIEGPQWCPRTRSFLTCRRCRASGARRRRRSRSAGRRRTRARTARRPPRARPARSRARSGTSAPSRCPARSQVWHVATGPGALGLALRVALHAHGPPAAGHARAPAHHRVVLRAAGISGFKYIILLLILAYSAKSNCGQVLPAPTTMLEPFSAPATVDHHLQRSVDCSNPIPDSWTAACSQH